MKYSARENQFVQAIDMRLGMAAYRTGPKQRVDLFLKTN